MVCIKFLDDRKVVRCKYFIARMYVRDGRATFCKKEEWKSTGRNYL